MWPIGMPELLVTTNAHSMSVTLITCLSEMRYLIALGKSYWMHHNKAEGNPGFHNASIPMNSYAHGTLISCWQVPIRLTMAWFKSTPFNMTICARSLHAKPRAKNGLVKKLLSFVSRFSRRILLKIP